MLKNYFNVAIRNLLRNKTASFIKIFSLSIGMICFAIISLFVFHELRFDRFHENPEEVYRVVKDFVNDDGSRIPDATTPPALAPALQKDLPEVAATTRVFPNWGRKYLLQWGDEKRFEEKLVRIDSSFFDVFSFQFIQGDKNSSLTTPNYILLSESAAKRYFGTADPIGKAIKIDIGRDGTDFFVTGVLENVPKNSHFTFDFLISLRSFQYNQMDTDWDWYNYYTYVRLKPGTNAAEFVQKLQPLFKKYNPEATSEYYAQALTDIHLKSNLKWELAVNGDYSYIKILSTIALFIVLLAAINYINLVTAQSAKRAKEVGIRKVTGANFGTLIRQFLLESMIIAVFASLVSVAVAESVLPFLSNLFGTELSFFGKGNLPIWILLGSITVIIGLLAGLYPSFYLSSFQPVNVLKGIATGLSGGSFLRKGLVTFQFVISTVLICGALVISNQIDFIRNTKLGFDKENILLIPNIRGTGSVATLASEFKKIAGVENAGGADGILGGQNWTTGVRPKDGKDELLLNFLAIDPDFLAVMNVNLKDGRTFSPQSQSDSSAVILNETAVKQLGIKEPVVGSQIAWGQNPDGTLSYGEVIGVIEDFHFTSFHDPIKPFGFIFDVNRISTLFVKVKGEALPQTIDNLKKAWDRVMPNRPFEFSFQDEQLAKLYAADTKFQKLFTCFTIVAILIACLGLFGLSAFMAEQRNKEIGIRKVLGANVLSVVQLLSKDFLKLILLAIVFALPIGWIVMGKWLENFAYKIELDWMVFAIAAGSAILIALATVSFQSLKAALSNPVDSLRSE